MAAAAAVARGASGRGGCAGARPRRCAARASHVYHYAELAVDTGVAGDMSALPRQEVSIHDLTAPLRETVAASGVVNGTAHLVSQHTTVALTINEDEARLRRDYAKWLLALAPPDAPYLHNDLEQRPETERDLAAIERNWMSQGKGTLEEFMAQEPLNAHAHLLASLLGTTLSVPVVGGELAIGQWQSVLMVELDGPRMRKVGCQVCGYVSHDDEQH